MSHRALQRVIVRMIHDPAFAARVTADPSRALRGVDLDPSERAWLAGTDPRAWGTDPLRPTRVLRALLEETAVSALCAARGAGGDPRSLDAFFASDEFHRAIQDRRSVVEEFTRYLARLDPAQPLLEPSARLEAAIAAVRRDRGTNHPADGRLHLAAGAALVDLPLGAVTAWSAARNAIAAIASDPVAALLHAASASIPIDAAIGPGVEHVLVKRDAGSSSPAIEILTPELTALLSRLPATREVLCSEARRLGADSGEDAEIVDDLLAQGLLVPSPGAWAGAADLGTDP